MIKIILTKLPVDTITNMINVLQKDSKIQPVLERKFNGIRFECDIRNLYGDVTITGNAKEALLFIIDNGNILDV